jgi:uncharacterized protein YbjT (DUF2867 family)
MLGKFAIVGANGFVGRHLLDQGVRRGAQVVGVVRSEKGAELAEGLGGRAVRVANLGREATERLVGEFTGCEGLVYTASVAAGSPPADRTDPAGLEHVLESARAAGVPRVVFLSGLGIAHFGMNPHCTNPYFLAKMAGEVALFRSGLAATVLRPSYIFGPGDHLLTPLLARMASDSTIEMPGDGAYRLQPISVHDAARAVLGALQEQNGATRVVDLVGPEIIAYRELLARISAKLNRPLEVRQRAVDEAMAEARASGYFGMRPHELDCLLCDEVSDVAPVEGLVGGALDSLDSMIAQTAAAHVPSGDH